MNTLQEILSPDFLLRNSVYVSVLVGLISPILGIFLVLRRLIFLGIALPQVSSTGIAFALALHILAGHDSPIHDASEQTMAFVGSLSFTLVAVIVLAVMERRGRGLVEGRLGTLYVVATALSVLMLAKCPQAERGWLNLLKGELVALSLRDLVTTSIAFVIVCSVLFLFGRILLLVSYDREMAITLGKRPLVWDLVLYLLLGTTISVSVLSVGPMIAFGFLIIPPLTAHRIASSMKQLFLLSSLIGGLSAIVGFWIAYHFDLPVGPTDISFLAAIYLVTVIFTRR
ncbi:MAG: metal ABC transporter permease [Verrucomicrobiota bacterium]|nr:metal ABC transporter permease [Verrucomicrobiota bacterium]